ncbi:MAG: DinB family protein, partial [Vicinamibacteria bacterium]
MGVSSSLLSDLDRMPAELERLVREVPPEHLRWLPEGSGGAPGETFAAIGHVCHLRDIEADGYHVRVRRMIEEERPSLVSIDGYELARERRYDEADLEEALAGFRAARGRTLDTLRGLTDAQLDRAGDFAEYGALTLRALLHYLRSHDQQH